MGKQHREEEEVTKRPRKSADAVSRRAAAGRVVDLRALTSTTSGSEKGAASDVGQRRTKNNASKAKKPAIQFEQELNTVGRNFMRSIGRAKDHLWSMRHRKSSQKHSLKKTGQTSHSAQQKQKKQTPPVITNALTSELERSYASQSRRLFGQRHAAVRTSKKNVARSITLTALVDRLYNRITTKLSPVQQQMLKPAFAFFVICVIVITPVSAFAVAGAVNSKEQKLTVQAERAFAHLEAAGAQVRSMELSEAGAAFADARSVFVAMQQEIDGMTGVMISLASVLPGKGGQVVAARDLVQAGQELSEAGVILSRIGERVASPQALTTIIQPNGIVELLSSIQNDIAPAAERIHSARELVDDIDPTSIPEEKRDLFLQAQALLPLADELVQQSHDLSGVAAHMLGGGGERRYLIVFQNNRELRPTGGFLGSFAIITVRGGVITEFEAPGGGIYDVAGQLKEKVVSPEPLHLVNPHWNIQDANWFPHFPDSAKKIQWFYERSNGSTVDGVVTLTPDVIEELLRVTGPLELSGEFEGVTVHTENVYELLQERSEEDFEEGAEPKRLLSVLTPRLLNATIAAAGQPETAMQIVALLKGALEQKDILVYMNDQEVQKVFTQYGWAGELRETEKDYLYVNHANVAGGKTDEVMDEVVRHHAEIQDDGSIVNTVQITRAHTGQSNDSLEGVMNSSFVRIYVPEGSQLLSAEGFEMPLPSQFLVPDTDAAQDADLQRISGDVFRSASNNVYTNTEYGKTVFGGWMRTRAGESDTVTVRYRLPLRIELNHFWDPVDHYSLFVQKQPGQKPPFFVSEVSLPENMKATSWYPENVAGNGSGRTQVLLADDYLTGVVIEPQK